MFVLLEFIDHTYRNCFNELSNTSYHYIYEIIENGNTEKKGKS